MFNPDRLTALPHVTDAHALSGHAARLTLADGTARTVSSVLPGFLAPLPGDLGAVFLEDWQASAPAAYFVPASLTDAVRAALNLCRVTA